MGYVAIGLIVVVLLAFLGRKKTSVTPKRTEIQKQDDELITVILPTIDPKN